MKITLMLLLPVAILLGAGCGSSDDSKSPSETSTSSGNPVTAPVDYLGVVAKGQQSANKLASTVGLRQAIQLFQVQEGRLPKNLQELVPNYIPRLPAAPANMKFDFDSSTGELKLAPQ
jgi:hypothetical protein